MTQHFLLLSLLILSIGLSALVMSAKRGTATTLSLHAASDKNLLIRFAVVVTLAVIILALYARWLISTLDLGVYGWGAWGMGLFLCLIVAWIPDTKGWSRRVHRASAYGLLVAMTLITAQLMLHSMIPEVIRLYAGVVLGAQIYMYFLLFFVQKAREHFLVYQILWLTSFFVLLLSASYLV